jgi:hypothetical protein
MEGAVMPKVSDTPCATAPDDVEWRECAGCGRLAALAPEVFHCDACQAQPVREHAVTVLLTLATRHIHGPGGPAASFARMAYAYHLLARRRPGAQGAELNALAADLREAAHRLRDGGPSS